MKWLLILMAAFALTASAADISGTWKGTAETSIGKTERTFVFKVDGNKLTGETTSNIFGKSTINDGKIDGDDLSFTITFSYQGSELKANYKGKVAGDEIKLTVEIPDAGQTVEYTVKRIS
jgi:hypothetical protein